MEYYQLKDYFNGKQRRLSYDDSVCAYEFLRFHFDGPDRRSVTGYDENNSSATGQRKYSGRDIAMDAVMATLIHNRRPSETSEIWSYRKEIFECITKEATSAVLRSLTKIKRSSDWSIKYPETTPPSVAKDETLFSYCEERFPMQQRSVTNWAFAILLKNLLIDPNAVCMVAPLNYKVEANEYLKPYPIIFNSNQVYEFIHDELAVFLTVEKTEKGGNVFLVVTEEEIQRWEQDDKGADYIQKDTYVHGLGELPCFRLPGIFRKSYSTDYMNESHLAPMVPRLNEAVREYSDMQAEVVQHVFSEKWEMVSQKCEECYNPTLGTSSGYIKQGKSKNFIQCQKCNGTGLMGAAPYKKIQIRPAKLDEAQTPIPPAGYIQKNIDIVKVQNERIDAHIYKALASINMQYLADTPLNQSGTAKEVDRDELNNFIYAIAEDVVKVMDQVYFLINEYRYKEIIPNKTARREQLPIIPVPQKFDLLSSSYLLEELKGIRDAGASELTIIAYETDFCSKKFYDQPEVKDKLILIYSLDPLPAKSEDEKLAILTGGGCTDLDYIISSNIVPFVSMAQYEHKDFMNMELPKQKEIIAAYAQPIYKANSMKEKALATAAANQRTELIV